MIVSLKGKTAFVSGATSGIGKAISNKLAENNCNLVLAARTLRTLQEVSTELNHKYGVKVEFINADFNLPMELKSTILSWSQNTDTKIDILINCVRGPLPKDIEAILPEEMMDSFNRHVVSSKVLADLFLPDMKKNGFGRIINVIDTVFKTPFPGLGLSVIRGAEASWIKALSLEVISFGITVNSILPGPTQTPGFHEIIRTLAEKRGVTYSEFKDEVINSIPIKRFASPEEIAIAALFMVSSEASYLTGASLNIDGGFSPSM